MTARNTKNEMLEAAALLAEGKSPAEVARMLGRAESTIRRWMRDDTARQAYREAILRTALVSYARAVKKLEFAGARTIFKVSSTTGEGLDALTEFLTEEASDEETEF